jgi:hypothetical protein
VIVVNGQLSAARWSTTQSAQAALLGDHGLVLLVTEPAAHCAISLILPCHLTGVDSGAVLRAVPLASAAQLLVGAAAWELAGKATAVLFAFDVFR